ncbi:uncharacterized protein BXZ73DRAFT_96382 [Epithele typhae]|uniref:uncharacterized protein n=1 Tax=Epithele typhae TaxID=378194 RepID=UPI002007511E|nr:uncharacterized protein BXZ73DRAFT_96382 [Epithele typhae]KAH9945392.1 hypothetical protein BXZ73DRAFT_96382 [Epithele typhae]
MPQLRSVTLQSRQIAFSHGISISGLRAILSVPALRELTMKDLILAPSLQDRLRYPNGFPVTHIPPLTSFHYLFSNSPVRYHPLVERECLGRILGRVNIALESLTLPAKTGLFAEMCLHEWPFLRHLRMYGRYADAPEVLRASSYPTFPRMRSLSLDIGLTTQDTEDHSINVRRAASGTCTSFVLPWPELDHIRIPNPLPEDDIYDRLPCYLSSLELVSHPHYTPSWVLNPFCHPYFDGFNCVPLTEANMLRILSRCSGMSLTRLAIEYVIASPGSSETLQFVAQTFPQLVELELFRRQPPLPAPETGDERLSLWKPDPPEWVESNVTIVANALQPLSHLRVFRAHLDLKETYTYTNPGREYCLYDWRVKWASRVLEFQDETRVADVVTIFKDVTVDLGVWTAG